MITASQLRAGMVIRHEGLKNLTTGTTWEHGFRLEAPISVLFPDMLEVRIADTTPPVHQQPDSTWKTALLENGVEIMLPQFIKNRDLIRLDMGNLKYMDRAKGAGK